MDVLSFLRHIIIIIAFNYANCWHRYIVYHQSFAKINHRRSFRLLVRLRYRVLFLLHHDRSSRLVKPAAYLIYSFGFYDAEFYGFCYLCLLVNYFSGSWISFLYNFLYIFKIVIIEIVSIDH